MTKNSVNRSLISLFHSRDSVSALLKLDSLIDLVIPRGSNSLVNYVKSHSKIPVLGHADGVCHVYIDEHADIKKALRILIDSKTDYPAACNSAETILLHEKLLSHADLFIQALKDACLLCLDIIFYSSVMLKYLSVL